MTSRLVFPSLALIVSLGALGCSAGGDGTGAGGDGNGDGTGNGAGTGIGNGSGTGNGSTGGIDVGGTGSSGNADECGSVLPVIFRDFKGHNEGGTIDFELSSVYPAGGSNWPSGNYGEGASAGNAAYKGLNEAGCGLVAAALGTDGKPVFASGLGQLRELAPTRNTNNNPPVTQHVTGCVAWNWGWVPPNVISSAATFGNWYYTDPAGVINVEVIDSLPLTDGVYDSAAFFPLDGKGFGNTAGQAHNYHFTTEVHVNFLYEPGQQFSFRGDDDLWVFVNGALAMDLGGVHEPMEGTIVFDSLGLTAGQEYNMDIFHAERQTTESNFKVTTNISCFKPGPIIR